MFAGGYAVLDIARTDDGFVAVGADHDDGQTSGAVWISSDGLSWSRVESPTFSGTVMRAIAAGDPGLVAVGIESIWFSPDGTEWNVVDTPLEVGTLWDVALTPWGFTAVGFRSHQFPGDTGYHEGQPGDHGPHVR